jgi:hypothetical protein
MLAALLLQHAAQVAPQVQMLQAVLESMAAPAM